MLAHRRNDLEAPQLLQRFPLQLLHFLKKRLRPYPCTTRSNRMKENPRRARLVRLVLRSVYSANNAESTRVYGCSGRRSDGGKVRVKERVTFRYDCS